MNRDDWQKLIASLPANLTQTQSAKFLRLPQGAVRHWIKKLNYRFRDGRRRRWTEAQKQARRRCQPSRIDWSKPNVTISREVGLSREAIRQLRASLGISKVNGRKPMKRHGNVLANIP